LSLRIAIVVACLGVITPTFAQNADSAAQSEPRPSEESIRHLLDVMQSKQVLQTMSAQMDTMFDGMLNKQLQGQDVTPEQQQEIDARRKMAKDMVKELLSWDSMERLYLKVYGDTFTQSEIDGLTAFYESPAGHALVVKMPLALKNTMAEMQQRVRDMIPKLQQMAKEAADEVKAKGAARKSG
jgi:uncharacterized protein